MDCIKTILNYEFLFYLFLVSGLIVALCNVFCVKLNDPSKYLLKRILIFLPYILFVASALFAYLQAGNSIGVSLYNAFGSFIYVSIPFIESNYTSFIKIFAVVVTANTLIPSIRNFVKLVTFYIAEKIGCIVYIVYGDSSTSTEIIKNFEKRFPTIKVDNPHDKMYYSFKNHIIAYDNDEKNMKLADELFNVKTKKNSKDFTIYSLSNGCDSLIFRDRPIIVLNKNELIVNKFWENNNDKIYDIFSKKKFNNCNISIVGSDELAYCFFKHILKNFVFDKKQSISINAFTTKNMINYFRIAEKSIKQMMTKDKIYIEELSDVNLYKNIQEADIVICTDYSLLSKIAVTYRYGQLIYIYNPSLMNDTYELFIGRNCLDNSTIVNEKTKVYMFGSDHEIFMVDNIIKSERTKLALWINYGYEKNKTLSEKIKNKLKKENLNIKSDSEIYGSRRFLVELNKEWENQNFDTVSTKELVSAWDFKNIYKINSNYASADYYCIRRKLLKLKTQEEMEWLEHTRWCRFMYLEGFKLGKYKNPKEKTHHLLKELNAKNDADKVIFQIDSAIYKFLEG